LFSLFLFAFCEKQSEANPEFTSKNIVFIIFANTSPATRDVFFEHFWVNQNSKNVFSRIKHKNSAKTIDFRDWNI